MLLATPTPPTSGLGDGVLLFGLLLGIVIAMLVALLLTLRLMRRSARARGRDAVPTPDPWLESGRRVDEGATDG